MPRIRNDPNFNICPDYTSDTFVNTRAQLINDNITEEQAVQLLRNIWEANNDTDKILWQQQVENDREQRAQRQRLEDEEQERLDQARVDEEDAIRKEERKISTTDGSTAWVSSASMRNACAIVSDEDLPFEDFCQRWKRLTGWWIGSG
ncbi:hypothetical protein BDR05DRAFT_985891 [Suillus weaverae]|nr:hypothetical protein BDR05DRAFT_985891 [Suillus weaverae]